MKTSPLEKTSSDTSPTRSAGWIPDLDTSTLGKRLVLLRLNKGWTSSDRAAREYGFKKETYRDYEKDKSLPQNLVAFCWAVHEATGVDFGWLFGGETMIGEQPPAEALEWLRMEFPRRHHRDAGARPNNGYYHDLTVRLSANIHPPENRPPGRSSVPSSGPGPVRPARLPRPRLR